MRELLAFATIVNLVNTWSNWNLNIEPFAMLTELKCPLNTSFTIRTVYVLFSPHKEAFSMKRMITLCHHCTAFFEANTAHQVFGAIIGLFSVNLLLFVCIWNYSTIPPLFNTYYTPPNCHPNTNSRYSHPTPSNNRTNICRRTLTLLTLLILFTLTPPYSRLRITALAPQTTFLITDLTSIKITLPAFIAISVVASLTLSTHTTRKPGFTFRTHRRLGTININTARRNFDTCIVPTCIIVWALAASWVWDFERSCAFLAARGG